MFYLPAGVTFTDTSSQFYQNAGTLGGNFYCNSCTMTFTSSTFKDNIGYDGSIIYMLNTASVTFNSVTMNYGRARRYGGAIYSGGTGASSITFSNCAAAVTHFESTNHGGFMYIANPSTTVSSTNCNYNHMYSW